MGDSAGAALERARFAMRDGSRVSQGHRAPSAVRPTRWVAHAVLGEAPERSGTNVSQSSGGAMVKLSASVCVVIALGGVSGCEATADPLSSDPVGYDAGGRGRSAGAAVDVATVS